jgi:hypothetical protein
MDSHNQARQANLALEKIGLTKDPWFRLTTTLIGINVTDSWKFAMYHGIINFSKKDPQKIMTVTGFAGVLGWQLINNALPFLSVFPTVVETCLLSQVPIY